MKFNNFLNSYRGMTRERLISRAAFIGMIVLCLMLSMAVLRKETVVVMLPHDLQGAGELTRNSASSNIKKAWGMTAANLVGNVSPGNVHFVEQALESLLAPTLYLDMMQDIYTQSRAIKDGSITMTFVPTGVYYQTSTNKVYVTGDTTRASRFGQTAHAKRTFEFIIDVLNYRPLIVEWTSYDGGPRISKNPEQLYVPKQPEQMDTLEVAAAIDFKQSDIKTTADQHLLLNTPLTPTEQESTIDPNIYENPKAMPLPQEQSSSSARLLDEKLKEIF